jgi:predicted nucleic acid-binding protein
VIYVDASVALAYLLSEARKPSTSFWDGPLISSRLLEYEVWNRLYAYAARGTESRKDLARKLLGHIDMFELKREVLARALMSFPTPVRTLDSLHLATIEFLRGRGTGVELASYDLRLIEGAKALDIKIAEF